MLDRSAMIAILGGIGAATMFATATLCSSRSSRMLGASSALAWVLLTGLAVVLPWIAVTGVPADLDKDAAAWLALAGIGNVAGLFLAYSALRIGIVGRVAPIVSTEGAIAALAAAIAGERVSLAVGLLLTLVATGIALASTGGETSRRAEEHGKAAILLALGAAVWFGLSLYATGRVSEELPLVWAVLPARAAGVTFVAVPLALAGKLRLIRKALPLVLVAGLAEIAGFVFYALGARHGIAVSAVLASQFGALAAVAAFFLFGERLTKVQLLGVALIAAGVALLSGLQA